MTGVSFEFKDGKLENLKATKGLNCLNELMSASGGPTNVIGGFSIGLNPGLKVHEEGNAAYYGGGSAAGVVYVSIGDNQLLGGSNITRDRKSTRLNSSHLVISYAVFCLKKKTQRVQRSSDSHTLTVATILLTRAG